MLTSRRTADLRSDRERAARHTARHIAPLLIGILVAVAGAAPAGAQAPPANAPLTSAGGSLAFQDPTVAIDPTDQARVAISYYDLSSPRQCALSLSSDGGMTWSTKVVVGDGGQIPLTGEQATCYSPKIAYGPSGTLYYIYQAGRVPASNPRQVLITTSRDGGATFDAPVLLDPSTERIVYAQVTVTVDQSTGRIYAGWSNVAGPANLRVFVASSRDEGRTFSTPVPVSPPEQSLADEPSLIVDSDSSVHVGWRVFGPAATTIFAATSRDQGQTFTAPRTVFNVDPGCAGGTLQCRRPVEYAADNVSYGLARGTSPGQLFAVGWVPLGDSTSNRRLTFSASQDGGATWTATRIVGIPAGHESDDQARPAVTVTSTGRIVIVYQNMPTMEGGIQNIFEIHSDDGGNSFSLPQQLNSAPSDIRVGPASFSTFNGGSTASLGAHSGIAASASKVFFAWTDTRRGTLDTRKQDIFLAALSLPGPPTPPAGDPPPSDPPPSAPPGGNPPASIPPAGSPAGCGRFTSKLSLARATFNVRERTISILAPITSRASGSVRITLFAAGRTVTFTAPIDSEKGRIRITRKIPAVQARLGTGLLTIRYSGDADTRPQNLRVRAAGRLARLKAQRPILTSTGFLRASGTVIRGARGIVRVKLQYVNGADGQMVTLERSVLINKGHWSLNRKLPSSLLSQIARRCGSLHSYTAFTGYLPRRLNGEQQSLQVLPAP